MSEASPEIHRQPDDWDRLRQDLDAGRPWAEITADYDIAQMLADELDPERSDLSVEDLARMSGVRQNLIQAIMNPETTDVGQIMLGSSGAHKILDIVRTPLERDSSDG